MTINEMREAILMHCKEHRCVDCIIQQRYGLQGACYSTNIISDLVRNYEAICGKAANTPDDCEDCEHEFDDKTKPPCVNCEGNTVAGTADAKEPPKVSLHDVKVQRHANLCDELNALYSRKNADYGDSFHKTYVEEGMAMARIRLSDKLDRFKTLTRKNEWYVKDESIRDTLIDLANYALLTVLELDGEQE